MPTLELSFLEGGVEGKLWLACLLSLMDVLSPTPWHYVVATK